MISTYRKLTAKIYKKCVNEVRNKKLQSVSQPLLVSCPKNPKKVAKMPQRTALSSQRAKQDDRLLKQLPRSDRKQQEMLRKLILSDPVFKTV